MRVIATIFALTLFMLQSCEPEKQLTPEEARAIAKEAYVYGNPAVDGYRIMYSYFVDASNPDYKSSWNDIKNIPRVYTHEDRAVQTPNSDTPYSFLALDLRAEPMVLTVPSMDEDRYFSIQLIDLYTHNFEYLGSRTIGNDGGQFLITGPGWNGKVPDGITKKIESETELMLAIYRTQLYNPEDLDNVKEIQEGYKDNLFQNLWVGRLRRLLPKSTLLHPYHRKKSRISKGI